MLQYMWTLVSRVRDRDEGQTLVEYGLIIALVSVVLIGALGLMTGALETIFTAITTALNGAAGGGTTSP